MFFGCLAGDRGLFGEIWGNFEWPEVNDHDIAVAGEGGVENRIRIVLKVSMK